MALIISLKMSVLHLVFEAEENRQLKRSIIDLKLLASFLYPPLANIYRVLPLPIRE